MPSLVNALPKELREELTQYSIDIQIQQYLKENGSPWEVRSCSHASTKGYGHLLKWAKVHNNIWNRITKNWSTQRGRSDVIQSALLRTQDPEVSFCYGAAYRGDLSLLKWARSKQYCSFYAWDTWFCSLATETGNLEVLQWLRHNECSWVKEHCLLRATWNKYDHIVKWINSQ